MVSGRLADSVGRKPMVLAGLIVSGGGTVWVGFTDTVPWFLTATVVAGLGAGLLSPPLQATVADVIGSRGRGGPVLATFQMAADIGAVFGPIAAGLLADNLSYLAAFAMTGTLCVAAALGWITAPETLPRPEPETRQHPTPNEAVATELPGCDDSQPVETRRATDPA
jgi:MFS family permease